MNFYAILAEVVVAIHVAFLLFAVVGLLLIVVGVIFRWNWVRNFWFRTIHLAAMAFVAMEELLGWDCILNPIENHFRILAGQEQMTESFIHHWMSRILPFWYNVPQWVNPLIYLGFPALVLLVFLLAPPRLPKWFRRQKPQTPAASPPQTQVAR